jgi:hypothetical protein
MQPFIDMDISAIIAWVAKNGNCYEVLRALPALLKNVEENFIAGCQT